MKIDGDSVFHPSNVVHNPNSKSFYHKDDVVKTIEEMPGKEIMKEDLDNTIPDDTLAAPVQMDANVADGFWPLQEFSSSKSDEVIAEGSKLMAKDSEASQTNFVGDVELVKEDLDLFTDKNVTECQTAEAMACYKGNPFCEVKDICVDEGVPSFKSTSSETDGNKSLNAYLVRKKNVKNEFDALESSEKLFEDLVQADTIGDKSADESPRERVVPLVQELVAQCHDHESSVAIADEMEPPSVVVSSDESTTESSDLSIEKSETSNTRSQEETRTSPSSSAKESNDTSHIQNSRENDKMENRNLSDEKAVANSAAVKESNDTSLVQNSPENDNLENRNLSKDNVTANSSQSEGRGNSDLVNRLLYSSNVESGSITFSFDSSAPELSNKGECSNGSRKQPEVQDMSSSVDGASNQQVDSGLGRNDHGESSFSMAGPVTGSISYSGPIAYSGSLSLRSDSSTTSTRSFAFPILQTEWNSSPVRMAKSDRRRLRRHRGWTQILCCRF